MTAPRQTAGRKTRRFAVSGDPERSISLVLCTCGFRISASRVHRAQAETGPGHRAFPVAEIFSARAWNDLPRRPQNEGSRPDFGWAEAWHASWIRGDRDAPGGLPSLSPRHGLPIARRHRGTHRCLRAPVGPLPSTRVPAWPYGTVAGKDDAAGCRKRTDSADDAAGSRTGRDDAAGRCIKDEAAGRRKIKDEAAGCRTGPATEAEPVAGSPSTQLQGMGRTRTRQEAVRSQSRWRGSGQGCVAGPVVQATGPADFPTGVGESGKFGFMHRPRMKTCRPVGEPGVRRIGSLRGALDRMRR